MISTDSDIGTSPSGTTFTSQPSSPQQPSQSAENSPSYLIPENSNLYTFFMDKLYMKNQMSSNAATKSPTSNESSSTNEHDRFRKESPGELSNSSLVTSKPVHLDAIDQLRGLSILSNKQLGTTRIQISFNSNHFTSNLLNLNVKMKAKIG